ncbi:MAG: UDP-N-acetylmuramate dehydrogenase [Acidobacteriota bacterium]|nr:UDP-N-acetylmuramate dehydrogenase [Acidobacteriota bacterium]
MHLEENKPLAPFTTFGIGGPARWYLHATSEEEIVEAVEWAEQQSLPLFVLGGGSNLLVSDAGFPGLVLHIALRGVTAIDDGAYRVYQAAAGEAWDTFVQRAVDDNCAGIECLAGIPGTVGGTPVQNVGAYGQEVASSITRVRAFDLRSHDFVDLPAEDCNFNYRRSRFNSTDRGRFIVTRVDYRLTRAGAPTLRYADLQRTFSSGFSPTLAQVAAGVRRIRVSKGMLLVEGDPDSRSAGSFFKNPIVPADLLSSIAETAGKQPPHFPADLEISSAARVKIPAAWLIEQAGYARGYTLGAAAVSSRHTLALINRGGATAAEILALADRIASAVQDRFGIRLDREPVLVGFDAGPSRPR